MIFSNPATAQAQKN